MILDSYNIAGINITHGASRKDCPDGFTRLLCSEKDWQIMQPIKQDQTIIQSIKAKSNNAFINWIIVGNRKVNFHEIWITLDNAVTKHPNSSS